ncbi:TorF family putative porin [Allosphingosinicella indica]|uniref:Porin n=1 Tax=Allosphingosinicella indica TaxID=941907 RepID=A0A1X7G570_9SPHN|nr:TorF family putative porin [Allosphingosinicella indica]SMF64016.1 conserved hypothetical protein [Allosphingosinicella indica]
MRILILAATAAVLLPVMPAYAADVSAEAKIVSDYRFRGISRSDGDPSVQGSLTIGASSGFYAGAFGASLSDDPRYGNAEIDVYAGYATDIASGTRIDAGVNYYAFPDSPALAGPTDYVETYARLSHQLGPVRATAGAAWAPSQDAIGGEDSLYLSAALDAGIPLTPWSLKGHVGRARGALDYTDWSLGVDYALGPIRLGAAYVDTSAGTVPRADATVVFSLGVGF